MLTQFLSTALMSLSLATGVKTSNISYDTNYELVYNKINSIYDNPSITNIEDIYNLVGENRYLKVDIYNDYYIIDKEDYKIIDNGLLSNDPYKNYTGLKLYLDSGLKYRYIGLNGDYIYDLCTYDEICFNETFESSKSFAIPLMSDYQDLRGRDRRLYTSDDIHYSENTVFCENYTYFERLNAAHHTRNNDDTCMIISFEILLSYYDTFLNDNIVDEEYEVKTEEKAINIDGFNSSPGVGNNEIIRDFHNYLIDNYSPVSNSLKNEQQRSMIKSYLKEKELDAKCTYCMGNNLSDLFTQYAIKIIKRTINSGRPLIANDLDHSVVAYAYDDEYVYIHTGWGYPARILWKFFKIDYSINIGDVKWCDAAAFDIDFNLEHVHSDNYYSKYYNSGMCPCGELHNHEIYHLSIDDDYHAHICECGLFQKEKHSLIADGYIKEVYVSLLNKYIKVPVITGFHCTVCNYKKEGE